MISTTILAMVPFVAAIAVLVGTVRYIGKIAILPAVVTGLLSFVIIQTFVASAISIAVPYPNMVLVAASNSSAPDKSRADYVVTGNADDELTAAVTYAAANGKDGVHCFSGTYGMTARVDIAAGLTFEGDGPATVFTPTVGLGGGGYTPMIRVVTVGVTLRDFRCSGEANRWAGYGVDISSGASNFLAERLTFTGLYDDDQMSVDGGTCHDGVVRNCSFTGNTRQGVELNSCIEVDTGPYNVTVENCTFTPPYYDGLSVHTHPASPQTHDITIRNNTFTGDQATGTGMLLRITGNAPGGVAENLPSYNITVSGNSFAGSALYGIWHIGYAEDCTFTGNSVVVLDDELGLFFRGLSSPTRLTLDSNVWLAPVGKTLTYEADATTVFDDIAFGVHESRTNVGWDAWIAAGILAGEITGL